MVTPPYLQQRLFRIPDNIAVSVGLSWDFVGAEPLDLDLSAVSFNSEGVLLDVVFFNHPFPLGTDEAVLRCCGALVDMQQLPYMFIGGDSRIGGEEENGLPGTALAARRRACQLFSGKDGELKRMGAIETVFSRIYEESDLLKVEEAMNETTGSCLLDENGFDLGKKGNRSICDESVTFVMHKIPSDAAVIFLTVTSYTGADFSVPPSVELVVVNEMTNERVGVIDLKRATGNGTANLACMLCRLPLTEQSGSAEVLENQQMWDLRELNIRTFGYTFVDVLPLMMDVLGVDENSRSDALWQLPDYPLTKGSYRSMAHPLSDVRFGVGWNGDHDLDAFMVMLDEKNNYVDHVYPKPVKTQSTSPYTACHSGDAINGFGTLGDEEFVDLVTYRVPQSVETLIFGVNYVASFGSAAGKKESIFDVPKLYMRMQNRTSNWPNSIEVDRWNIHHDVEYARRAENTGSGQKEEQPEREGSVCQGVRSKIVHNYVGPDGRQHPVRTLVLGMLVKKGEASFSRVFEGYSQQNCDEYSNALEMQEGEHNQDQQEVMVVSSEFESETAAANDLVPLFDYCPLHEYLPVGDLQSFSELMPYLRCIAKYRRTPTGQPLHWMGLGHFSVNPLSNRVAAVQTISPSIWEELKTSRALLDYRAVKVQFLEIRHLKPTLPHIFKCHGEVWVCEKAPFSGRRSLTPYDVPTFRTPFLNHRQNMVWDEKNPATSVTLFVREFDRLRAVVYDRAAFGYVDIDLMQIEELWCQVPLEEAARADTEQEKDEEAEGATASHTIQRWFQLSGGPLSDGMLRLRLSRVPVREAMQEQQKVIERVIREKKLHEENISKRMDKRARDSYSWACGVM
ncbi:TerD domain [Trypanosoma vivax]|uniref:Uncharacterized protein n=1 Tax=Trypanosoma vivax (strain Y486) TaxID=1055687 RepID=G0TUY3_TRYVY|nr:hypothetical protein TRVL_01264 [Trypanosoma vivax]KAH8610963.1 TerD domain [Trypanosoma vivax]CCC47770.1 conserved hypothetical protein [Trypanosoma vivax Y486]